MCGVPVPFISFAVVGIRQGGREIRVIILTDECLCYKDNIHNALYFVK